jgi:hypothetical protein
MRKLRVFKFFEGLNSSKKFPFARKEDKKVYSNISDYFFEKVSSLNKLIVDAYKTCAETGDAQLLAKAEQQSEALSWECVATAHCISKAVTRRGPVEKFGEEMFHRGDDTRQCLRATISKTTKPPKISKINVEYDQLVADIFAADVSRATTTESFMRASQSPSGEIRRRF